MKFFISCLVFIFSTGLSNASEVSSALLEESDFQALSAKMKKQSLGLVLMLHAEDCPYCALMENEILSPMVVSGDYDNRVVIRKLQIDDARDVKDFDGSIVKPSDISDRYGATLTPTLIFLDYRGKKKAETMVGINTIDYFGVYLDEAIDKLVGNIKTGLADISKSSSKTSTN
ncbi:MAG TPA: hypothetical protein EYH38_02930 [Leucothrix sp.]|nr:hypothetical protein [Leucothrix sp.]HIQ14513.1 hypothetical protein [Leucothrix sp.]